MDTRLMDQYLRQDTQDNEDILMDNEQVPSELTVLMSQAEP